MGSPRLLVVAALCGAQRIPELPSLPVPNEPFAVLEHVNLNSGRAWDRRVDAFYFDVLRCARDSRASHTLTRTNDAREVRSQPALANLSWANVGLQQFHLPFGDGMEDGDGHHFQTMRGEIALLYARGALDDLRARLEAWGAAVDDDFRFEGPFGNRFVVEAVDDSRSRELVGPVKGVKKGGMDTMFMGISEGVGIRGVAFDVPTGAAKKICKFYDVVFHAKTTLQKGACAVAIGFEQRLTFTDVAGDVPAYDGHHLAIYVNGDAWTATYDQLFVRGLLYNNPRFPQFKYDSLKDALEHNEFRIRGFPDLDAVEGHGHPIIFELEHEIRNLRHPGFALKSRLPRGPEHGFFGNEL